MYTRDYCQIYKTKIFVSFPWGIKPTLIIVNTIKILYLLLNTKPKMKYDYLGHMRFIILKMSHSI